jgi:transposase
VERTEATYDDGHRGTFTSGIVSIWREWRIALYFTGWKHAGENLADVLKRRAAELDAPIQMCDALSRNTPRLPGEWRSCWPTVWLMEDDRW